MAAPCGLRWNCRSLGSPVRPVQEGPLGDRGGAVRPGAGGQQVNSAAVNVAQLLEQCPVLGWSSVALLSLSPPVPAGPSPGTRPPGVLHQRGFSSRPWGPSIPVPFPSGNRLLPTVVVSTHCLATSEAAHHGYRPSTVSWGRSLWFEGAHGGPPGWGGPPLPIWGNVRPFHGGGGSLPQGRPPPRHSPGP